MMISLSNGQVSDQADHITSMDEVFAYVREDMEQVEKALINGLRSDVALISQVGQHIFQSGGKRMRPLLTILCSRICGYQGSAHVHLAAAIELIHTATLLHDDVVDHAEIRRGSRSVNYVWDSETSVLVGDFLFTHSFCMMVDLKDPRVLDLMSRTCRELAEGEILELVKSGDPLIQEQDYLHVVRNKTAVLISAACRIGAILGRRPAWEAALAEYGINLGMAFQLIDDVLDYEAKEQVLGKAIGKDLQEGKVTIPIIRTLERCTDAERARMVEVILDRSQDSEHLQEIHKTIQNYDGLRYAHAKAQLYVDAAKAALSILPDGREKTALFTVAEFVASRTN